MSTALVTGGSAGIGRAVAERLLAADYEVVSLDLHPSPLKVRHVEVDLTDTEATLQAATEIARNHAVTTLIHNAGAIRPALLQDVQLADLAALANLHLGAAITLTQAALPAMKEAGYGRIVFVSSRAVLGVPTRTAYAATKAGIVQLARAAAAEFGPSGVRVNAIAPGVIETPLTAPIKANGEWYNAYAAKSVFNRWGRPEELVGAAVFLASDAASYVTGSVIFVDGGWLAADGRFTPPGM